MTEFLDLIQSFDAEVRNAKTIFTSEDGVGARSAARRRDNPMAYRRKFSEAVSLLSDVKSGRRSSHILQEVMSTDDFPLYFGDILDRVLLAKYTSWPVTWTSYAKRAVVNDFRDNKLILPLYGADTQLDLVPEGDQYPDAVVHEQEPILWSVDKYGRRIPITWETLINDNLGQFSDLPDRLATAARRTEHRKVTALFVDANGPHAGLYTSGNKNIISTANGAATTNPPLSVNGLQDAYTVISKMLDENGEPIMRELFTLVVPPALEVRALNMLNAVELRTTQLRQGGNPDASDSGYNELTVSNWMKNKLRLEVDPYIPAIASNANGNASWFLFANPTYSREAIRIGFLRGHETPEIRMKSANSVRVGGGVISPFEGDFDTDSVEYRVRHVTGVTLVDPKATVASNGSGS